MEINVFAMLWDAFLQQPIWFQAILIIGIILRLVWPKFLDDPDTASRRRGKRRRYHWYAR